MAWPRGPAVRIEEVCRGIRRLAAFEPACCVCLTGPQGDYETAEARELSGDGVADLPGIFGALNDGGFDGWFELEVLSDDGTFGEDYPDSLWKLDPVELIRTGREQFMRAWESRPVSRQEVGDR